MQVKTTSLVLVLLLSTTASSATPSNTQRGFLSGLGIGLLALTGVGAGVGVAGMLGVNDAELRLKGYAPSAIDSAWTPAELNAFQGTKSLLVLQSKESQTVMYAGFIGAGVALAGGIVCLILDSPSPKAESSTSASLIFIPTTSGGFFSLSGQF